MDASSPHASPPFSAHLRTEVDALAAMLPLPEAASGSGSMEASGTAPVMPVRAVPTARFEVPDAPLPSAPGAHPGGAPTPALPLSQPEA